MDKKTQEELKTCKKNSLIIFWHNRLFLVWKLYKFINNNLQIYALVSPSKDGAWISELFKYFHVHTVRGSSKRRGMEALNEMSEILNQNSCVAITTDGPRGPRYKMKPGAAILVKNNKSHIVVLSVKYSRFWEISSWDKFRVPKPFSSITFTTDMLDNDFANNLSIEEIMDLLQKRLEQTI